MTTSSALPPTPFLKQGVILAHLISNGVLMVIFFFVLFFYAILKSENQSYINPSPWEYFTFVEIVMAIWVIQLLASFYSIFKLLKEETAPRFRFVLIPLGLLSLGVGLFLVRAGETVIVLIGLYCLLYAITAFQTFRMLSPPFRSKNVPTRPTITKKKKSKK
ncbi:MAG: hypothetical protein V1776_03695 [Candidatus Diapherotrites archaeon]